MSSRAKNWVLTPTVRRSIVGEVPRQRPLQADGEDMVNKMRANCELPPLVRHTMLDQDRCEKSAEHVMPARWSGTTL